LRDKPGTKLIEVISTPLLELLQGLLETQQHKRICLGESRVEPSSDVRGTVWDSAWLQNDRPTLPFSEEPVPLKSLPVADAAAHSGVHPRACHLQEASRIDEASRIEPPPEICDKKDDDQEQEASRIEVSTLAGSEEHEDHDEVSSAEDAANQQAAAAVQVEASVERAEETVDSTSSSASECTVEGATATSRSLGGEATRVEDTATSPQPEGLFVDVHSVWPA